MEITLSVGVWCTFVYNFCTTFNGQTVTNPLRFYQRSAVQRNALRKSWQIFLWTIVMGTVSFFVICCFMYSDMKREGD